MAPLRHIFIPLFTISAFLLQASAQTCLVTIPPNALSPEGFATPFVVDGCTQTDQATATFIEGMVLAKNGSIYNYNPLLIQKGTKAEINPSMPNVGPGATYALWFGTNGASTTLVDMNGSLKAAKCVNGFQGSIFGQFACCNCDVFFQAANAANVVVPPLGTDMFGQPCPTTSSFAVVDQDQSDNVITTYLVTAKKTLAQDTPANRAKLGFDPNNKKNKVTLLLNGSDAQLVGGFMDKALGCTPMMVPDLASNTQDGGNAMRATLATLQLQAKLQASPVALVPAGDPMVTINGTANLNKLNAYRVSVNQPPAMNIADASTKVYCQNMKDSAPGYLLQRMAVFTNAPSPAPAVALNLHLFLAQRFQTSWGADGLGCMALFNNATSPITATFDGNGVAIAAQININPTTGMSASSSKASASPNAAGATPSSKASASPNAAGATPSSKASASPNAAGASPSKPAAGSSSTPNAAGANTTPCPMATPASSSTPAVNPANPANPSSSTPAANPASPSTPAGWPAKPSSSTPAANPASPSTPAANPAKPSSASSSSSKLANAIVSPTPSCTHM